MEYAPFQEKPDMPYSQMWYSIHCIKEVSLYDTPEGRFKFPPSERKDSLARLPLVLMLLLLKNPTST